jgi:hypothetical protein
MRHKLLTATLFAATMVSGGQASSNMQVSPLPPPNRTCSL